MARGLAGAGTEGQVLGLGLRARSWGVRAQGLGLRAGVSGPGAGRVKASPWGWWGSWQAPSQGLREVF